MKKIPLTKNKFAIVDDEDYPYLNRFRWIYNKGVFATLLRDKMKYVSVPMGHFIVAPKNQCQIAHKNNNDLDFRKRNLVYFQDSQKTHHGEKRKTHFGKKPTSKYKGVSHRPERKTWTAGIDKDKKHYHIGTFQTEGKAAIAYNEKARELYGEMAYQNKV